MAYTHAPLEEAQLGPGVWKVVKPEAPAQLKTMVARGLAPLPPRDLVVAMYHFWCTNDPKLAEVSANTVSGLPPAILNGALDDSQLPAGVLDFLGRKLLRNAEVLDRIVRHPNADDESLAGLARLAPEGVCDTLADNQERWLRFPAIVESLYQNPNCRMSVVHRMLELAVREGVDLKLPNMEEIKAALADGAAASPDRDGMFKGMAKQAAQSQERAVDAMGDAAAHDDVDVEDITTQPVAEGGEAELDLDELFSFEGDDLSLPMEAAELPEQPEQPEEGLAVGEGRMIQIRQMSVMEKIRLALLGTAFDRAVLIRDSNKSVSMSAIKSPKVKENEAVAMAANRSLSHDVIRYIAGRREWIKLYAIKLNLVMNPKTPMAKAMTFLGHLHAHDVKKVARSKNIPSALAKAAKRKVQSAR